MTFDKLDKTFDIDSAIDEVKDTSTEIKKLSDNKDLQNDYEYSRDITDKLVDLQGKMKDINQETTKTTNNVTNAMFVGSTSELQKMLKEMGKDK